MLTELRIVNLGVVRDVCIDLGPGLTVLTGETGAGKSVLLGAISLLTGARADAEMVRPGAPEARVDGRLLVPAEVRAAVGLAAAGTVSPGLSQQPEELAESEDLVEVVLSRVIPATGRSRAYVDGHPVTAQVLGQITSWMEIHGQHGAQSLLSVPAQRAALDAFGVIDDAEVLALRSRRRALDAGRQEFGGDARARAREIELLAFQIEEISAVGILDADELEALDAEDALLADAWGHRDTGTQAYDLLQGDEAARTPLATALRLLGERPLFAPIEGRLVAVLAELDDLSADLRALTESIEEDPERLEFVRRRRQALRDLCRKYGADLREVMTFAATARLRLEALEDHESRAAHLDAEISAVTEDLSAASQRLRAERAAAAPEFAAALTTALRSLAMPEARVEIRIGDAPEDLAGDQVEIMLAANPGLEAAPVQRAASGGELSRTMLAIHMVRHGSAGPCEVSREPASTLVFDEVDAGVGGTTAVVVAEALRSLVGAHQVVVVTHLAQVAAAADTHLRVTKVILGTGATAATETEVHGLSGPERVAEVARMLSGQDTGTALRHATELLEGHAGLGVEESATN